MSTEPENATADAKVIGLDAKRKEKRKRPGMRLDTRDLADNLDGLPNLSPLAYARDNDLSHERDARVAMRLMHRDCAVVAIGANVRIAFKERTVETQIIGGHRLTRPKEIVKLFKRNDFLALFEGTSIWADIGGAAKQISLGEAFLKSQQRTIYNRIVFAPGDEPRPDVLNLWRGWGIAPKPGDWSILREHIEENICAGDQSLASWTLDWMADIVQKPERKSGTALAFKGLKGTGKTKAAEWLSYLIGDSIIIDKAEHLTGQFNAHLSNKLLVVADEAMWGGNKQSVGALNTLITSPTLAVERKGYDTEEMRSSHRVIIIGNADWLVPATSDERRYAVLEVGTGRQTDHAYFAALDDQMVNGGAAAMLFDLLRREITNDVMTAPRTAGLGHQIAQGLRTIERLLVRLASEGVLRNPRTGETVVSIKEDAETTVGKAAFMDLIEGAYGRAHSPREVGSAIKAAGIRAYRPHGGNRELIFPPGTRLIENLENHLRVPLNILTGGDADA